MLEDTHNLVSVTYSVFPNPYESWYGHLSSTPDNAQVSGGITTEFCVCPHLGEASCSLMLFKRMALCITLHLQGLNLGPDIKNVIHFGCSIIKNQQVHAIGGIRKILNYHNLTLWKDSITMQE